MFDLELVGLITLVALLLWALLELRSKRLSLLRISPQSRISLEPVPRHESADSSFLQYLADGPGDLTGPTKEPLAGWLLRRLLEALAQQVRAEIVCGVTRVDRELLLVSPSLVPEKLERLVRRQCASFPAEEVTMVDCEADRNLVGELSTYGVRFVVGYASGSLCLWLGYPAKRAPDGAELTRLKTVLGNLSVVYRSLVKFGKFYDQCDSLKEEVSELKLSVAQLSHDVRSALTSFVHGLEFLGDRIAGSADVEALRVLELARINGNAVLALLEGYVEISRDHQALQSFEPAICDAAKLAREAIAIFLLKAQEKGLKVTLDAPESGSRVLCQASDLRRILLNVVGNSVKFTDTGAVRIEVITESHDMTRIVVVDTGPGISGLAEQDFGKPHMRGISDKPGSGLGLSVATDLVSKNGGTLHIFSTPGRGTRVEVALRRAAKEPSQLSNIVEFQRSEALKPAVLIVDDDKESADSLARLILARGYQAAVSTSVDEALEKSSHQPTVITDLDMPAGGGQRLIRELKKRYPEMHIGVLSGTDDELKSYEALGLGAEIIFRKPAQIEELLSWLNRSAIKAA